MKIEFASIFFQTQNYNNHTSTIRQHLLSQTDKKSCLFLASALCLLLYLQNKIKISHVIIKSHFSNNISSFISIRLWMRINTYCFSFNMLRLGSRYHCSFGYIKQKLKND